MRDMHIGHDPVVIADARDAPALDRASIQRAVLTNDITGANLKPGLFASKLFVLRCTANRAERVDFAIGTDVSRPFDHDMRADLVPASIGHHHLSASMDRCLHRPLSRLWEKHERADRSILRFPQRAHQFGVCHSCSVNRRDRPCLDNTTSVSLLLDLNAELVTGPTG